ncbi:helix-turn-helix domain-containing protein [Candidatus Woesearchaeota archaeon]|nr:helix-turn-helix domain-containing protein [Candidatus Woesearchaeota archaeon]
MDQPQELEVWYLIPSIRRELAINLKNQGLKQKQIAQKLNITEPAVSNYIKNKRANTMRLSSVVLEEIELSAKKLYNNKSNLVKEIQSICELAKKTKLLCKLHYERGFKLKNCDVCLK